MKGVFLLSFFVAGSALADDWPQWRGPQRDGVWREHGVVEQFAGEEIELRWRVPVSSSYSGPTVADGRVYLTDRVTKPEQMERVLCFESVSHLYYVESNKSGGGRWTLHPRYWTA